MIILGLTGSIGMGKSTTAQMFRDEGCAVFDADATVHQLYARGGKAVPIIRSVFPDAIKNGAVNRQVLGKHMRADPLQLTVLESFVHPLVGEMRSEFLESARSRGDRVVVMDEPLLFEMNQDQSVDKIAVVTAPKSVQRERVMSRPGMTEDLFRLLLSRQLADAEKRKRADYLIFTDKGLENARNQVRQILKELG